MIKNKTFKIADNIFVAVILLLLSVVIFALTFIVEASVLASLMLFEQAGIVGVLFIFLLFVFLFLPFFPAYFFIHMLQTRSDNLFSFKTINEKSVKLLIFFIVYLFYVFLFDTLFIDLDDFFYTSYRTDLIVFVTIVALDLFFEGFYHMHKKTK